MKRLSRVVLAATALAALAAPVAACGAPADGAVTLRMIESLTSPDRSALIRGMLDDFEKANPKIKVQLVSPPLEGADQKISQLLAAKQNLDVLEVRDHTVAQFVNNKSLLDLTPYTEKWSEWEQLTDLARDKAAAVGGKPYLIPYGFYQKTLFVRTDRLDSAGLGVPTTWQELYDAAVKLTDKGKNRFGYSFRGGTGSNDYAALIIQAYLGDKVDPAEGYFTKDGKTIFAAPEAKQAMALFLKLFQDGSPPGSTNWAYPEMVQGFTSGVTSLLIQDPEVIATAEDAASLPKGSWTTVPLPKGPTGYALQPAGYAGWGATSFSKHRAEAAKLVQFLSSAEQSLHFAKNNSLIPIHTAATKDRAFNSGHFKSYLEMADDPKHVIVDRPIRYKGWSAWLKKADADVQRLILGKTSVNGLLRDWDTYWTKEKSRN